MMDSIFSDVLLDHYRHPRHYGTIDDPDLEMDGANPLCGDEIHLQAKIKDGKVEQAAFTGKACAICTASTSMFCEQAPGSALEELQVQKRRVNDMLQGKDLPKEDRRALKDIYALQGVSKLPVRIKCALLVWETWGLMVKE